MEFNIPRSLKTEHEELHSKLVEASRAGGRTGDAAKAVAEVLYPHFEKEEGYALPPLGLLPLLAEGNITQEMANVIPMTERLKAEFPQMLRDHRLIIAALQYLLEIAIKENMPEYAHFAEKLMLHAQTEEEVLYPASILIGEYLKLRLKR